MTELSPDRQAALRLLARAHRALVDEGFVTTEGLLPAWRALQPAAHPGAGHDAVDVAFLGRVRARFGPGALQASRIVVGGGPRRGQPRASASLESGALHIEAPSSAAARGELLGLALGLALEGAKVRHGLTASPEALRAVFASPAEARATLDALASCRDVLELEEAARTNSTSSSAFLDAPTVDTATLQGLARDRPVYVVTGVGAHRIHDLLSPFARRLREVLMPLGQVLGAPAGEEAHAAIDLISGEAGIHQERHAVESADGFTALGADVIAVRCDAIAESEADRRCRDAVQQLKRARALLVLVAPHGPTVLAVLSALSGACRLVAVLEEGTASCTPAFVEDAATGHILPIDNAFNGHDVLVTIPALGFAPHREGPAMDAGVFPIVAAVLRARAHHAVGDVRLAVRATASGDSAALTSACVETLSRLAPASPRGRR